MATFSLVANIRSICSMPSSFDRYAANPIRQHVTGDNYSGYDRGYTKNRRGLSLSVIWVNKRASSPRKMRLSMVFWSLCGQSSWRSMLANLPIPYLNVSFEGCRQVHRYFGGVRSRCCEARRVASGQRVERKFLFRRNPNVRLRRLVCR